MLLMDLEVARRLYRTSSKDLFDEDDKRDELPIGVAVAVINHSMEFNPNFEFVNETHFPVLIFKNSKGTNTDWAKFNQRKKAFQETLRTQTSLLELKKVK